MLFRAFVALPFKDFANQSYPMLRLLLSEAQGCKDYQKTSKTCHVGINWEAFDKHSQLTTHVPGFQSFVLGRGYRSTQQKPRPNPKSLALSHALGGIQTQWCALDHMANFLGITCKYNRVKPGS